MDFPSELELPPEPELGVIRCYTCNKLLGAKFSQYEKMLQEGYSIEHSLNVLGLIRPCCRLRLRNPFKVVMDTIEEPKEISTFERLSIADDLNSSTTGALNALSSSSILMEPENEIQLKPVRTLPSFPKKKEAEISRTFKAW